MATEKLSSARVLHLIPSSRSPRPSPSPSPSPSVDEDTIKCLELLLSDAKNGNVTGLAFCAILKDRGYIADTAGEATKSPTWTRGALRGLDDKLAARMHSR